MCIQAQLNQIDVNGNTPLHRAAEGGFVNHAEDYLRHGADVNIRNNRGETPLDVAGRRVRECGAQEKDEYQNIFSRIEEACIKP